jgi:hypothetical protein
MNTAGAECGISAPIHERLGSERYRIERCDLLVIMAETNRVCVLGKLQELSKVQRSMEAELTRFHATLIKT